MSYVHESFSLESLSQTEEIELNVFRQEHKNGFSNDWISPIKAEYIQSLIIREWLNSRADKAARAINKSILVRFKKRAS